MDPPYYTGLSYIYYTKTESGLWTLVTRGILIYLHTASVVMLNCTDKPALDQIPPLNHSVLFPSKELLEFIHCVLISVQIKVISYVY